MLNYIAAELYKLRFQRLLWVGALLLLGMETLLFLPVLAGEETFLLTVYQELFALALPVGVMIAPVFAAAAYDDQAGRGTLKNEIVYGIPRSRIYLGKLVSGAMAGTACALAAALWYLLLTAALGEPPMSGDSGWPYVFTALWCNWCVWMAAYAVAFFLFFALRNTVGAVVMSYTLTLVGGLISTIVSAGAPTPWQEWLAKLFYTYPIVDAIEGWIGTLIVLGEGSVLAIPSMGRTAAWALAVAAIWVGGTAGAGLLLLHRREIK